MEIKKDSSLKEFEEIFCAIGNLSNEKLIDRMVNSIDFKKFKKANPDIKYFLDLAKYNEKIVAKVLENIELEDGLLFYVVGKTGKYFRFNHLNFKKPVFTSMSSKIILYYVEISGGNDDVFRNAIRSGKLESDEIINAFELNKWESEAVSLVVEMIKCHNVSLSWDDKLKLIKEAPYCLDKLVSEENLDTSPSELLSYVRATKNVSIGERVLKTKKLSGEQVVQVIKLTKKGLHCPVGNSGIAKFALEEFELSLEQQFEIIGTSDTFFKIGEYVLAKNEKKLKCLSGEQLFKFCQLSNFDQYVLSYAARSEKLSIKHLTELLKNTYLDCVRLPLEEAIEKIVG